MNKIVIVPVEPLESRYTGEWYSMLPQQLRKHIELTGAEYEVVQIEIPSIDAVVTPGAFLNFASTQVYKSKQFLILAEMFASFVEGDKILFTDAWNPVVIQLRYMKDLMKSPVELHGMWHAGSYDEHDFLGRAFDKRWSYEFERSLVNALDVNYFATTFHHRLLSNTLNVNMGTRAQIVGWPMEYLKDRLIPSKNKKDLVLFPHRVSDEKQPELFRRIAKALPQYEFVIAQDTPLTKAEYHELLNQAKVVFSASLQETLGIGVYEGYLCGAVPIVPDRLSYSEMFMWCSRAVMYPARWTELEAARDGRNFDDLVNIIESTMEAYEDIYEPGTHGIELDEGLDTFFDGHLLYKSLCN